MGTQFTLLEAVLLGALSVVIYLHQRSLQREAAEKEKNRALWDGIHGLTTKTWALKVLDGTVTLYRKPAPNGEVQVSVTKEAA